MGERIMTRKQSLGILVVIIALQCGAMFYWASRKAGYYIDELFTFEYVQNINNHKDSIEYMDDSSLWKVEDWLSVKDLKTRYTMEEGESVFDLPISLTAKKFFFDRNYMWIINALETVFGRGGPPKWICICFNIFVWILFQLLLFFFLDSCLGFDRRTSLLAVTMWGFCPMVLELSVYCRFYAWTLLLFFVAIVLHKLMWDGTSHKKNILYEVAAILTLYLAFKNSELIFVIGGALIFFFAVGLIAKKRYLQAAYYSLPLIVGGILFSWKKSHLLDVIFHPSSYASMGHGATARLADYLVNSSMREKIVSLLYSLKSFAESVGGGMELTLLIVILGLMLYWAVRKHSLKLIDGFDWILIGTVAVFWLFCGLCGVTYTRYYSFMFLLIFILLWVLLDRMAGSGKISGVVYKVAFAVVLVASLMPFYRRDVTYVYEGLKPALERVSAHSDLKAVVDYDPEFNFNAYYSTYMLDGSSSIYPVCRQPSNDVLPDLPEAFLFWESEYLAPSKTLGLIRRSGYSTYMLYASGKAIVYLCEKH